jgi:hypothetical protein
MAQANIVWVPIAIGSYNHTTDLAFVITPELARIYLLSLGLLLHGKKHQIKRFYIDIAY